MENLIHFSKYHGTGNDFIIFSPTEAQKVHWEDQQLLARICHRRFGIGADGIMSPLPSTHYPYKMLYYNSDGKESSFCGNGSRCLAHYAFTRGLAPKSFTFLASDGEHFVEVCKDEVSVQMLVKGEISQLEEDVMIINTGSPHYLKWINQAPSEITDFVSKAKAIRMNEAFKEEGINVNLVFLDPQGDVHMRTYERGVEDETLSCGTGVTAAALGAVSRLGLALPATIKVFTQGGELKVHVPIQGGHTKLIGGATHVYDGVLNLDYFKK